MKHDEVIEDLLGNEELIVVREHRALRDAVARAVRDGRVARVLPGVYAAAGRAHHPLIKMAAVARWDPNAVIWGRGAALLTYWPEVEVGSMVQVATPSRHRPQPGFAFCRRLVPRELRQRCGVVSVTAPSLTAIDLATLEFTDPIDEALRSRQVTVATLQEALRLTANRRGNADRWRVLLDSRAEPWSRAERLAHRLYRDAGITGWTTNVKLVLPGTGTYYLDIALEALRIAIEVDGLRYHAKPDVFEADRVRQNALVLDGWLVLRFTWRMLTADPEHVVTTTLAAIAARRAATTKSPLVRSGAACRRLSG